MLGAPSEGAKDFFDRLCSALSTSNAFAFAWQALGVALVEPELRNELADTELLDMLVEPALRRGPVDSDLLEKLEVVLSKLKETSSNTEFLVQIQKSLPGANGNGTGNGHKD